MSLPLVFHREVQDEVDDAFRWYERQRSGLGDRFLAALEEVYRRLGSMPLLHQVIFKDIRRGLLDRFPYGVFYRAHPDRVEVIAVYHLRRDPSGWQSRA